MSDYAAPIQLRRELRIMRRPKRRTHLYLPEALEPMCGTIIQSFWEAEWTPIPIAGGATARLKNDLIRELDGNACIPCTRIALGMLALYVSRDGGKPW